MSVTRTITVAAGAFAPGQLGELTRIVPFELADAVLEETGARERRLRLLPSRVGVYFLLAMCLFPRPGYLGVWAKLAVALDGLGLAVPSPKALRELRRRLGSAPLRTLFGILAGPLGQPRTPGVMSGRYRTVAFDGCRSVKVAGSERNRGWLGKLKAALGETGYPAIQLMTLCETGTRALIGAVFGTPAEGEQDWARKLLHLLDETMLVLMDRGFDAGEFLAQVAATKAQFLVRLTATRRPPVLARLPDGSFLSVIGGVKVRIIAAEVTVTCHDGTRYAAATGSRPPSSITVPGPPRRSSACTTNAGSTRWPTSPCGTPCSTAAYCARATRPAWNRRCGACWRSTRRCGLLSPTPSRPSRAPAPTGPATR